MKVEAIIPSAGVGARMNKDIPKPLLQLNGQPLIIHTLRAFESCDLIDAVILVVHRDYAQLYKEAIQTAGLTKVKEFIAGGESRGESISNALSYVDPDTDLVVVHDGARPMVTVNLLERAIRKCTNEDAVIAAVAVKSTIKKIHLEDGIVERTVPRDDLYEIQTPQVFKKSILWDAYEQAVDLNATDDASLVEQIGIPVKIVEGDYQNMKVTTKEDLIIAEAFLKEARS